MINEFESRKTNDKSQRHKNKSNVTFYSGRDTLMRERRYDKVIGQATMFVSSTNHCTAGNSMQ